MQNISDTTNTTFDAISNKMRFFTEREAWTYFRAAAFGEAIGWTILLTGIGIKHFFLPQNNSPVVVAGQIHGTIFFVYFASVFVLFASLRWSARKTLLAALASIPPYGTLVFEKWAAHKRQLARQPSERQIVVRAIIKNGDRLLLLQPKDSGFLCLPGGLVKAHETVDEALTRIILLQTGQPIKIFGLRFVIEYRHRGVERLELLVAANLQNSFDPTTVPDELLSKLGYDSLLFRDPGSADDIEPKFLKAINLPLVCSNQAQHVQFLTANSTDAVL